jgi:FkbH-like protein
MRSATHPHSPESCVSETGASSFKLTMRPNILIAASFTGEFLRRRVQHALAAKGFLAHAELAHYGQTTELLINPASALFQGNYAVTVLIVRPEDTLRQFSSDGDPIYDESARVYGEQWLSAFLEALPAAMGRLVGRLLLCVAPPPLHPSYSPEVSAWVSLCYQRLESLAQKLPEVEWVPSPSSEIECYDPNLDAVAHMPYRPAYQEALADRLARVVCASWHRPIKVIIVDGDGTLWAGACAELGPRGIGLSSPYLNLQRWLVAQAGQGRLICLVSHNVPADILAVLNSGQTILGPQHLAASRIDWRPKPELVQSLAEEFGFSLDAFAFLDDNPVERSLMKSRLPEIKVIDFPSDPHALMATLEEDWDFDGISATDEDKNRLQFFRQESKRSLLRQRVDSHHHFLKELQVRVEVAPLNARTAARAAQLAVRTTQFNTTNKIFAESELIQWVRNPSHSAWVANASDRLGEYGTVGLVLTKRSGTKLTVSALMLSCRVLQRGIEGALLYFLVDQAAKQGCAGVELTVVTTLRNEPVRNFLRDWPGSEVQEAGDRLIVEIPVVPAVPTAGEALQNSFAKIFESDGGGFGPAN